VKLFPKRVYTSGVGVRWCFWRWSDAQEPYLDRLWLVRTPWGSISLNWIKEPDQGDPHDHTFDFLSIILRGWYTERRLIYDNKGALLSDTYRERRHFNYIRGTERDRHRILSVARGGCLTISFAGARRRNWKYHTPEGEVVWSEYKV
jgi:hypothetical protein